MIYLGAFLSSMVAVFLKGIQHKNVQHNLYGSTFLTSCLIGVVEAVSIGWIVRGGWSVGLAVGTGAGIGMVGAMLLHRKLTGK